MNECVKSCIWTRKPTCCLCWPPPPPWPPSLPPSLSSVCNRRNSRLKVHSPGTFTMELKESEGEESSVSDNKSDCYVLKYIWGWSEKYYIAVYSPMRWSWAQLHTYTHLKLILGESAQFLVPSAVWRPGTATERLVHLSTHTPAL